MMTALDRLSCDTYRFPQRIHAAPRPRSCGSKGSPPNRSRKGSACAGSATPRTPYLTYRAVRRQSNYSMTSSARTSSVDGTSNPSAAVGANLFVVGRDETKFFRRRFSSAAFA
jgi:hypothetical protein